MKKTTYLFSLLIILLACNNQSEKKATTNQGDCFENFKDYKPTEGYELVKLNIYRKKVDSTFYFLTCDYSDGVGLGYLSLLDETVDIASLEDYGEFWTDKNHVYYEYSRSDGVQFSRLDTADRATFKTFGKTIYARDKNHIYDSRHGIIKDADVESFHPIAINPATGISNYGKDQYNYFFWDDIVEDTLELKEYLKIE